MSYSDAQQARSAKPIIAVALLHVVIAYGFISGLTYRVTHHDDPPIVARNIPEDAPPPPKALPLPQRPAPNSARLAPPDRIVERPDLGQPDVIEVSTIDPGIVTRTDLPKAPPSPPLPPSAARGPGVIGDRAAWVTADDYPAASLRQSEEGIVGITVAIGADGRVTGCEVTATSGSALLDQQTCRIYARRARFTPALDAEGRPTATHRADRVRWQMPAQ